MLSFFLGVVTVAVIVSFRKLCPKMPMSVIMMFVGALLTILFHLDELGVKMLPEVAKGLPTISNLLTVSSRFRHLSTVGNSQRRRILFLSSALQQPTGLWKKL